MLIAFLIVSMATLTALLGGRLRLLAEIRLRGLWLVWAALLVQVIIMGVLPATPWVSPSAHLLTYLAAGVVVVWNRRVPGVVLLGAGVLLNGFTIAVNGGTLPASGAALAEAEVSARPGQFLNSGVVEDPRLSWLGDRFVSPAMLPFRNTYSIGDVLIVLGAGTTLVLVCRPLPFARGRRQDTASTAGT